MRELDTQHRKARFASGRFDAPWFDRVHADQLPSLFISPFFLNLAGYKTGLRKSAVGRQIRSTNDRRFFYELMLAVVEIDEDALHKTRKVIVDESFDRH